MTRILSQRYTQENAIGHSARDYAKSFSQIKDTIGYIITTQKAFDTLKKRNESTYYSALADIYSQLRSIIGLETHEPTFSELFSNQIDNVSSLNISLRELISYSKKEQSTLSHKLFNEIDKNKIICGKYLLSKSAIPKETQSYQVLLETNNHSEETNPSSYDKLREEIIKEEQFCKKLEDAVLLETVHKVGLSKINFLRSHIMFHRGILFSAKKLALHTNEVCGVLDHIKHLYDVTKPLGDSMSSVLQGLTILKTHTTELESLYDRTYTVVSDIERETRNPEILNRQHIDSLVSRMLSSLEQEDVVRRSQENNT